MKMIQIQWTSSNMEEARKIAFELIEAKLIACANIFPVESIFSWQGKIDTAHEVKVLFKTREEHYPKIREWIEKNGSYEVPEVSKIIIDETNPKYLEWVKEVTS